MKNYEQMTQSVLIRAEAERMAQKRKRRTLLTAAACLCVVGLTVFAGAKARQTGGEERRESRVSVFCITANAAEQPQQMLKDGTLPYDAILRVRDITGLSDSQVQALQSADKEYAEELAAKDPGEHGKFRWSVTSRKTDRTLVTTIYAGFYYLTVDDYAQVRDISVTTTGIGDASVSGVDYYDPSLSDGVGITWSLSGEGLEMIETDPERKLSQITDTVTVTVEFLDGTKEIAVIDITVDDAGQIYGTFRGTSFA